MVNYEHEQNLGIKRYYYACVARMGKSKARTAASNKLLDLIYAILRLWVSREIIDTIKLHEAPEWGLRNVPIRPDASDSPFVEWNLPSSLSFGSVVRSRVRTYVIREMSKSGFVVSNQFIYFFQHLFCIKR